MAALLILILIFIFLIAGDPASVAAEASKCAVT